jgi:hypothetical protein
MAEHFNRLGLRFTEGALDHEVLVNSMHRGRRSHRCRLVFW